MKHGQVLTESTCTGRKSYKGKPMPKAWEIWQQHVKQALSGRG